MFTLIYNYEETVMYECPNCASNLKYDVSKKEDSRISKERRPSHIIPFSKTEADCRTAYQKMLKHAIFAPNALKDENHINKFRGIYMPYWVYSFEKKDLLPLKAVNAEEE